MFWLLPVAAGAGLLWWLAKPKTAPAASAQSTALVPLNAAQMAAIYGPPPPYAGDIGGYSVMSTGLPSTGHHVPIALLPQGFPPIPAPVPAMLTLDQLQGFVPPYMASAPPMGMPVEQQFAPPMLQQFASPMMQPQPMMHPFDMQQSMQSMMPFDMATQQSMMQQQPMMQQPMPPQHQPIAVLRCASDRCWVRPQPMPWDEGSMGRQPNAFTAPRGFPIAVLSFGPVGWAHVVVQHHEDGPVEGWIETRFLDSGAASAAPQSAAPTAQPAKPGAAPTSPAVVAATQAAYADMAKYMAARGKTMVMGGPATGAAAASPIQGRTSSRMRRVKTKGRRDAAAV